METNDRQINTLGKLRQLLYSHYGVGVNIRRLVPVDSSSELNQILLRGDDLHIPLRVQGTWLGMAVVNGARSLDDEKRACLTELVRTILEPALYSDYLNIKESNLVNRDNPGLSLVNTNDGRFLLDNPSLTSNIIHLTGGSDSLNKKIALEIHEITNRWAFLTYDEISDEISSALELIRLGPITLYVPSVCSVQTYGQKLLFDFVKYPRSMQEPLIVTCSRSSLDDLRRNSTIHPDLATAVAPFEVQTDSLPCSDWGLREALELLLVKEPSSPI